MTPLFTKLDEMVQHAIDECPNGGELTTHMARVSALKQMRAVVKSHFEDGEWKRIAE